MISPSKYRSQRRHRARLCGRQTARRADAGLPALCYRMNRHMAALARLDYVAADVEMRRAVNIVTRSTLGAWAVESPPREVAVEPVKPLDWMGT